MIATYDLPDSTEELAALATRAIGTPVIPTQVIETGFDHRVLLARHDGAEWVFRFPRRPDVLPDLARERRILALLGTTELGIPVPDWQVDTTVDGLPVLGYPAVPGRPAGEEPRSDGDFVLAVALPLRPAFLHRLGRALAAVHTIPSSQVAAALGPAPVQLQEVRRRHLDVVGEVPPILARRWRAHLEDDRWWTASPTLVHGDVHPGHTLIDDRGELTGLLDWTDGGWGDPAVDFVDTLHCYGPDTTVRLIEAYRVAGGDDTDLLPRVRVLRSFGVLKAAHDAVLAGRGDILDRARRRLADLAAQEEDRPEPRKRRIER